MALCVASGCDDAQETVDVADQGASGDHDGHDEGDHEDGHDEQGRRDHEQHDAAGKDGSDQGSDHGSDHGSDQGSDHGSDHREPSHGRQGAHKGHGDHKAADRVKLDAESIERAGIEVDSVDTGSLRDNVKATAVVKHDVNRVAHITPLVQGQISDIRATLGDDVEAGQTLAVMRSVALGEARSSLNEAQAALEVARQNHERQQKLVDKGIASERSFIEAEGAFKQSQARHQAARSRLRTLGVGGGSGAVYPLKSEIDGTIVEQHASIGETKGPQDKLFVVADQSVVWVMGQIAEKDAHAVHQGMKAVVTLDAYPERVWKGSVDWIASMIDPKTRLLPIRVELDNPDNRLKPGMFGTIQLSSAGSSRQMPLVPVGAVQQIDGQNVVFVTGDHAGEFRAKPVELGTESGGLVEVVTGLSADATIVSQGAFDVKAAMTAGGRSAAHHH